MDRRFTVEVRLVPGLMIDAASGVERKARNTCKAHVNNYRSLNLLSDVGLDSSIGDACTMLQIFSVATHVWNGTGSRSIRWTASPNRPLESDQE